MNKIWHTPEWYEYKIRDDNGIGRVKSMLKSDCGDYYDPIQNDSENIQNYRDRYISDDFIEEHGSYLLELYLNDMKIINKMEYLSLTNKYGSHEETYLNIINKLAEECLVGNDEKLISTINQIRRTAEVPLSVKKRASQKRIYKIVQVKDGLKEDTTFFTWNDIFGSQKDYNKERNYLVCVTNLLVAVEKRIEMISNEKVKMLIKQKVDYMNRLSKVVKVHHGDADKGWVTKHTYMPNNQMTLFNEEFEKSVKETEKEIVKTNADEGNFNKFMDSINHSNSKIVDGFG